MTEELELAGLVCEWETAGLWVDRGRWRRTKRGVNEYVPTKREIATKCKLFRTIPGCAVRTSAAPRGGEFGVPTTAGI